MSWEIATVTSVLGLSFMTSFIASKIEERHNPMKFFLILLSFLFLDILIYVGWQIALLNNANIATVLKGSFVAYQFILLFVVLYFMAELVLSIIDLFGKKNKNRGGFI